MYRHVTYLRVFAVAIFVSATSLLAAPVHDAAKAGNVDEVKRLLDAGVRVDAENKYGYTPLFIAALEGHLGLAKFLVREGADIEARSEGGRTPLAVAAFDDQYAMVQYLIGVDADVDARTQKGETPLQWVARKGSLELAGLLISNGAEVNARDNRGNMPLHWAVELDRKDMAELLLVHGAQINAHLRKRGSDRFEGNMPLHIAVSSSFNPALPETRKAIEVAKFLIDEGADINGKGDFGDTPLHKAANWDVVEIAEILIEKDADVNARNDKGNTPLMEAAGLDQVAAARLLISAGADVNAASNSGATALHEAARNGQVAVATVLIEAGADVNARNAEGDTPLNLVPAPKRLTRQLLEKHGAERVKTASSCMTVKDIEGTNSGAIKRVAKIKGNNAKLFLALDPIWSAPELQDEPYRDEHYIASIKEAREALAELGINEVVVWKFTGSGAGLGVALPFEDGCSVSGYGEPDVMDKLMLMRKTLRLITKHGLDDTRVRDSIKELLMASRYARHYKDEMVDIMIDRLRPLTQ